MGFRFRKSFKIAPGVRLNVGKRGLSTSIKTGPTTTNLSGRGVRQSTSIPGTGVSLTSGGKKGRRAAQPNHAAQSVHNAQPFPSAPAVPPEPLSPETIARNRRRLLVVVLVIIGLLVACVLFGVMLEALAPAAG